MEAPDNVTDVEDTAEDPAEKPSAGAWLWSEFKFFGKLGLFILAFITLVWGHFKIPSESMQPTLEVGDHLYVSKYAYGYSKHSLPYLLHRLPLPEGRIFSRLPKRGDVVVFRNSRSGIIMIKRVVGVPGDSLQVRRGQLFLNGKLVRRERIDGRLTANMRPNVCGASMPIVRLFPVWMRVL
jgi:signal peptidase I